MVLLKPLSDALRDKDPIRAVIAHSGVSQDGRTKGITLPNGNAQEELIRRVYREANLNPKDCGFAEMHGTGTKVGDPIEATAMQAALGGGRTARNPLYIGSVKSNVGHLEGASGVISIIKTTMMLDSGLLLPNADYKKPNPNIPFAQWNMKVVNSTRPWPRGKKYASVSGYGFGGTNAHVVLEQPPQLKQSPDTESYQDPKRKLFLISANDKESLARRIQDYTIYFEQRPEVFENSLFSNFAYTLGSKMSNLSYRVALSATSLNDLGVQQAQLKVNPTRVHKAPTIAFVFTGQGAQWAQMGIPLMDEYPTFKSAVKRADRCLREDLGADFSLIEELKKDSKSSQINTPYMSQPACTALQIALTDLLRSWGLQPTSVMGHSSGEIGAAYAAGIFGLEAAMTLAYRRGQMTKLLKESFPSLKGTMMAAGAGRETIEPMLKDLGSYATVACVNSPSSVTISGDAPAIDELQAILEEKQLFNRKLKIDVAYHSDHMKNVADEYLAAIDSIQPSASEETDATLFSSVTGDIAQATELGPAYWVQNLTSPVLFANALGKMCVDEEKRPNLIVEVGPHSALKGPILDTLKNLDSSMASKVGYTPTVIRNADPAQSVLDAAGAAYVRGATLDMTEINFPCNGTKNRSFLRDLPKYPWQHGTQYWHETRISKQHKFRDGIRNDILGAQAIYSNDLEPTWRNIVRLDDIPWLRDHKMQGMNVYPISGYVSFFLFRIVMFRADSNIQKLAMATEAVTRRRVEQYNPASSQFEFREVKVGAALVLTDDVDAETTITLRPYAEGTRGNSDIWDEFRICSWTEKRAWTEHCTGLVRIRVNRQQSTAFNSAASENKLISDEIDEVQAAATYKIDTQNMYQVLAAVGAGYGTCFQGLENCFSDPRHSRADLYVRDTKNAMPKSYEAPLTIHPALLDGLLHLVWPILGKGCMELDTLYMPTMIKNLVISGNVPSIPGEYVKVWCIGGPSQRMPEPTKFNLWMTPENSNEVLVNMEGLTMTPLKEAGANGGGRARDLCYKFEWQPLAEIEKALNDEAKQLNAHAEKSNGHDANGQLTNGHINGLTNGLTNGDVNGYTNGHLTPEEKPYINGNGIHQNDYFTKRDVLIAQFGKPDVFANKLNISISNEMMNWLPLTSFLGDIDSTGKHVIVLQTGTKSLRHLTEYEFENIKKTLLNSSNVLWVYRDDTPDAQMIVGLTRSLRSETLAKVATLGLEPDSFERPVEPIMAAMEALWPSNGGKPCEDCEFKAKGSELFVPRAVNDDALSSFVHKETTDEVIISSQPFKQPDRRFKLEIGNFGSLDSLYFADDDVGPLDDNDIEIEVMATGLNFKDIVVTMGQLAQPYIGIECSGIVSSVGKNVTDVAVGQRVMALPLGSYSTYARCKGTSATVIPDNMPFEVAATVPVVFCTAYYALYDLGRLYVGERVLIHAGAGGVGQAAIMLAQMARAEIFVTVGSIEKKDFLITQYGIPEDHIFYSRDSSFGRGIRRATNDEGVDLVINSLAGDLLRETWECLAPFGRFIEIGKADITKNTRLDMMPFEYNVTFSSVDLTQVAAYKPKLMKRLLDHTCSLMDRGHIRPILPLTSYRISEIETAFRSLQTGKMMGKNIVVPHPDDHVQAVERKTGSDILKANASYILIGGTGGLGRSMARWMSSKGARVIVLVSRSASNINDKVQALIRELAANGTHVIVKACDVSSKHSVDVLINEQMKNLPPVRGVVHGAMVLQVSHPLTVSFFITNVSHLLGYSLREYDPR